MANTLVTSSMNPSAVMTTYNVSTAHKRNETASQAIDIGNLQEESAVVSVSDAAAQGVDAVSTSFNVTDGDTTSLNESFGNLIDQATTRFQLFDGNGAVIADSQGTDAQQAMYQNWVSGGLSLSAGAYTAVATPADGEEVAIKSSVQQGTSLGVTSSLTGGDTSEYYNFSLSGNNIKLAFDAGAGQASTRVQLYDGNGHLVADSDGNAFQKANFIALTSSQGLTASNGSYSVKVSYAPGADTTKNIDYNFQLYSGVNYAVTYNTKAKAQPADYTAAGSVTATTDAQLYKRNAFNKIDADASSAINIGWLAQNKSSLSVLSQLTGADNADYYSFTLQTGDNLKFGFDTKQTPTPSSLRMQLYDSTGSRLIADSGGTPAQQAAYKSLTTTDGLKAKPGDYVVKISYAQGAPVKSQQYVFGLYSGTSYNAEYKTIASAQTYGNALLAGNVSGSASNSTAIAAYLTSLSGGNGDIFSALSALV